ADDPHPGGAVPQRARPAGRLGLPGRGRAAHPLRPAAVRRAPRPGGRGLREAGGEAPQRGGHPHRVAGPGADGSRPPGGPGTGARGAGGSTMRAELLQLAADLAQRRQPFVLAMVVRRQPYSSAQQGDMAIITAEGGYYGWLGGNCTQPVVKREAVRALADGRPRLLSLSPDAAPDERPGVTVLPMVCQSGGTAD